MMNVRDNPMQRRFELEERGLVAFASYRRHGDRLIIDRVESPPPLRGAGTAGRLMDGITQLARADRLRVTPLCSYAALWLRRRPEHHDLLDQGSSSSP
jgi:predicted GNAT family acetyltransferase